MPAHVYEPYTEEDDRYLWRHKDDPLEEVAEALGRGSKSCVARLKRLRDPTTDGYRRLFGCDAEEDERTQKLRPARDCITRIIHDPALNVRDFRVGYRDRFATAAKEAPFDAPNQSVKGAQRMLVLALPEHRIEYLKFRRRLVWSKEQRLDDIFGSRGGSRIQEVVETYRAWATERQQRTRAATTEAARALGSEEALATFMRQLAKVRDGALDEGSLVQAALSDVFFGADGEGAAAEGDAAHGDGPLVGLLQVLPDEHAILRESLEKRVRDALRGSGRQNPLSE